jgi:hypothetical protein
MPKKDRTGPEGKGPKTGRQQGDCDDTKPIVFGRMSNRCGKGLNRGLGRNLVNKKCQGHV